MGEWHNGSAQEHPILAPNYELNKKHGEYMEYWNASSADITNKL
jgi:hypothetical protein